MKAGKFTGKLNPFPQSKLTYGFPFRETPSTYTTVDYLTGEGRLQQLPYFYITMGVGWLLIMWSGGGCALSSSSGSLSVIRWCRMRASGFSFYRREEPSGLRKRWTPGVFNYPSLLLPGQLDDNAAFNNCPGYSRTHY